jgi:hypothetical protein
VLSIAVGFLLGILASYICWYFLFHKIVPRVEFLPQILVSSTKENSSGKKYRIRFQNVGRREVLDFEVIAKLRIQGLIPEDPVVWRAIYIPVDDARIPKLGSHRKSGKFLAIQLLVNSIDDSAASCLPSELQDNLRSGTLDLEALMNLGKNARLQLFAFGYDEHSGARKAFESKLFDANDIVQL